MACTLLPSVTVTFALVGTGSWIRSSLSFTKRHIVQPLSTIAICDTLAEPALYAANELSFPDDTAIIVLALVLCCGAMVIVLSHR
jgi:hypothetical protein